MRLSGGRSRVRRIGYACVVAAAVPRSTGSRPDRRGAGGTVFGGTTAQGFPVVIETSKNGAR